MTRANIYVCNTFIGEIGGDAYPGGDLWNMLMDWDNAQLRERQFVRLMKKYIRDHYGKDYLPPKSRGVGNWTYEYMFVPMQEPKEYTDWQNWKGRIFYREPADFPPWESLGQSYYQIPGPWMHLSEYAPD